MPKLAAAERPKTQGNTGENFNYKFIYSIVFLCFLLSGISGLTYEVVWTRMLTNVFGGTTLAVSTVLTAFLGGLALGSYIGGKFIDHFKKPLLAYGCLELMIGLYGVCVPIIFSEAFLAPVWQTVVLSTQNFQFISYLVRFFVALILLGLPTVLMGATLPILSRYLTNVRTDIVTFNVGSLYTVNTAGAIIGTFMTGFILLPAVGVNNSVYIAASLNLVLATLVIFLAMANQKVQADTVITKDEEPGSTLEAKIASAQDNIPLHLIKYSMLALAISGFVALTFEVVWTRVLTLVLGSSTYAFTTMLTTFLIGLTLGTAIMTKVQEKIERPVLWIGALLVGIGITGFITACLFNELPWMFLSKAQKLPSDPTTSWFILTFHKFVVSSAIMFFPTLLSGMIFPLVVRVYSARPDHIGESVGKLYSVNTFGSIIGSFSSGFIFIPLFGIFGSGIHTTTKIAILCALASGLFLIYNDIKINKSLNSKQRKISISWVYITALVGFFSNFFLMPAWDKSIMTTGVAIYHSLSYKNLTKEQFFNTFKEENASENIVFYKEGLTTVVSVTSTKDGNTTLLKNNGKVDAGVPTDGDGPSSADMVTQVLLGQLPLLLHKNEPENVLVVGLGSGCTAGSVVRYPSIKNCKVCEIEQAVIDADKYFEPPLDKDPLFGNGSPLNSKRNPLAENVEAIHTDGRNYLLTTDEKFDIIISQPADPWVQGASALFTKEFWELGAKHLKENGLFCEWIQLYSITPEYLGVLVNTFKEAFGKYENGKKVSDGYVYLFRPGLAGEVLLIGSNEPIKIDVNKIKERIKTSFIAKGKSSSLEIKTLDDLTRVSIHDEVDIISQLILGPDQLVQFTEAQTKKIPRLKSLPLNERINTDNNVIIEFEAPKKLHLFYAPIPDNISAIGQATNGDIEQYLVNYGETDSKKASFLARLAMEYVKKATLAESDPSKAKDDPNIILASYLAKRALELSPSVISYVANYTINQKLQNKIEADHYFEKAALAPKFTVYDWIAYGQVRATNDDLSGAISAFRMATQIDPENDSAWAKLGEAVFNQAQQADNKAMYDEAMQYFKKSRKLFPYNVEAWSGEGNTYFTYASRYKEFENIPLAEEAYLKAFMADLNYWPARLNYAKILYGQGPNRYEEAKQEFVHIIRRLNPAHPEARYLLGKIYQAQGGYEPAGQLYQSAIQLGLSGKQRVDAEDQIEKIAKGEVGQNQNQAEQKKAKKPKEVAEEDPEETLKKLLRLTGKVEGEPTAAGDEKAAQEKTEKDEALEESFQPKAETPGIKDKAKE